MRVIAEGLGVRLSGRVIFENVAFEWNGPGIYTVTGNNGAGKTTLLKVVAALLHPGRGAMRWENGTGEALTAAGARSHLGFAGPEIGLWEDLTALENFAFGARARGLAWSAADGAAWLERLGLSRPRRRAPGRLLLGDEAAGEDRVRDAGPAGARHPRRARVEPR